MICSSVNLVFFTSVILQGLTDSVPFSWYGLTGAGHYSCIAEKRAIETIVDGKPSTEFMKFGDTIRIKMKDKSGQSL